ncbi:MAG: RluA family pseudouridine synthase [Treponema sp.]|jgi:23S rRNA pseudouridine955/2504/2580 synthase|nr:RluA family pseudouridine synthase [Treponema sp.]
MTSVLTLVAAADDDGRRLDRILRKALPDMPLSAIHGLLRKGRVLVDGAPGGASDRVRAGAAIRVPISDGDAGAIRAKTAASSKQKTPPSLALSILWESADFLALNKPAGLATHGPESLETLVQAYLAPKLPPSLSFKPGPLHRLDKPTSGIVVFSASLAGARAFSALLRERRVRKTYLALLDGTMGRDETWEDILARDRVRGKSFALPGSKVGIGKDGPKEARTRAYPLASASGLTLARLELDTGRTHQIRAQAAAHRHPLAGDRKYGGSGQRGGFLLHAWTLELPEQAQPPMPRRLEAPLPDNFRERIRELFGEIDFTANRTR